jgi:hypothetical protein
MGWAVRNTATAGRIMDTPQTHQIRQELERRILHGMAMEWEAALWVLSPSQRQYIQKPFFRLKNLKHRLGYWSHEHREICLATDLAFNHPWDAVREVLIHEMAHQFAHEVLGARDAPAHGTAFQEACKLLRANPKASGSYPALDERISNKVENGKDRILRRIRKLMALAKSKNHHEAELAMAKAHELIAKYNIKELEMQKIRQFESIFLGKPALRHFREDYHLAGLLQDFYFIFGLWVSAYVFERQKMGRVLEITGTRANIQMAAYVYNFVRHFIDSRWREYNHDKGLTRYRKTDFAVGIIDGFRSKLEKNNRRYQNKTSSRSLMRLEDPLLVAYTDRKYPHTKSFRPTISSQNRRVVRDGRRLGKRLVISRGITEKGSGQQALIGNNPD